MQLGPQALFRLVLWRVILISDVTFVLLADMLATRALVKWKDQYSKPSVLHHMSYVSEVFVRQNWKADFSGM